MQEALIVPSRVPAMSCKRATAFLLNSALTLQIAVDVKQSHDFDFVQSLLCPLTPLMYLYQRITYLPASPREGHTDWG